MKRIIFGLMLAMMFCTLVQGANRTVTENDGEGNKKRVIELRDTVVDGEPVTDTLSIMTYENGTGSSDAPEKWRTHHSRYGLGTGSTLGARPSESRDCRNSHRLCIRSCRYSSYSLVFLLSAIKTGKPSTAWRNRPWPADSNCLRGNFFKEAAASGYPQQRHQRRIRRHRPVHRFCWGHYRRIRSADVSASQVIFHRFGQLVIFYSQQKKNEEK